MKEKNITKKDNDLQTDETITSSDHADIEAEAQQSAESSEEQVSDPLETARREAREYLDSLQRLKAEFDNFRKRMAKERSKMAQFHQSVVLEAILPTLDSFDAALRNPGADVSGNTYQGLKLIYDGLMENLSKLGFKRMEVVDKPFDPEIAEAILVQETETHDPNTVIGEISAGYYFKETVLRAARVVVSSSSTPDDSGFSDHESTDSEGDQNE